MINNYKNYLDVDRIQRVLETKVPKQGSGKTFATLMLMLGEAFLGDPGNTYLYIGETKHRTQAVKFDFELILQYEGFTTPNLVTENKLFVGDDKHLVRNFLFYPACGLIPHIRGHLYHKVFVDLSPETYEKYKTHIYEALGRERR